VKYFVTIGDERLELELRTEGVVFGSEGPVAAEIASVPGSALRHLLLDDESWRLTAARDQEGWTISTGGRRYRVRIEDERTHAIRELSGADSMADGPRELRAPMPGLVVKVLVEEGQDVQRGDGLVVMEAMKMENELRAEASGRVSGIRVEEGATVARGQVLVTMAAGEE
jgi:biotin carboxyl carrier protein